MISHSCVRPLVRYPFPKCPLTVNPFAFGKMRLGTCLIRGAVSPGDCPASSPREGGSLGTTGQSVEFKVLAQDFRPLHGSGMRPFDFWSSILPSGPQVPI